MDPDPHRGDTDPIDYSKHRDKMCKRGRGISNDFIEVRRIVLFFQPLDAEQLLSNFYVLLVW